MKEKLVQQLNKERRKDFSEDNELSKEKELENKIRNEVSSFIDKNIEDLKDNTITINDFLKEVLNLKLTQEEYNQESFSENFDRSWNIDQVTDLLNLYEKEFGDDDAGFSLEVEISRLLTTSVRYPDETNTVSDLVAQSFIERIEKGEPLKNSLDSMIRVWANNIQMASSMDRIKLYSAINGNPGKITDHSYHELVGFLTLFGKVVIDDFENKLYSEDCNLSEKISIIEILKFASFDYDVGFEDSRYQAIDVLNNMHQNYDKYFLKKLTDLTLPSQNQKLDEVQDSEIRIQTDLSPLSSIGYYNSEARKQNAEYNNFSKKYNLIYTSNGKVDSFFSTDEPNERLSIYDILEKEGVAADDMLDLVVSYRALLYRPIRSSIEQEFQINLSDFTIREQIQFLTYIAEQDELGITYFKEKINEGKTKEARNARVVNFFALEHSNEFFDLLAEVTILLNEEVQDQLYIEYAEIFRTSQKIKNELEQIFPDFEKDPKRYKLVQQISKKFLGKAYELLHEINTEIDLSVQSGIENNDVNLFYSDKENELKTLDEDSNNQKPVIDVDAISQMVINKLEGFRKNAEFTLIMYERMRRGAHKNIRFEDIEGVEFEAGITIKEYASVEVLDALKSSTEFHQLLEKVFGPDYKNIIDLGKAQNSAKEFSDEVLDRKSIIIQMFEMYNRNYEHMPELKQKIILGLISLLESQTDQTELYITKQEGEVFAFCRFDKDYQHDGSGVEYFGSMNVGRKGQALGTSFFETVLEREKKGVAIDADCVPSSPVSSAYVERYGFVMTQVLPNYSGDDTLMAIQRREQNQQYHYREGVDFKDREALKVNRIELIKSAQERNNEYDVEEDHFVLMFDYPPREGDITIMEQIVNKNGYHITRYFPSRSNQKDITLYVAFEKPMTSDSVNQKGIDQETFTELFGDN